MAKSRKPRKSVKIIRILMTVDYLVEVGKDGRVVDDGRTPEELAQHWFGDFSLGQSHAARDNRRVGFSENVMSFKVLNEDEL